MNKIEKFLDQLYWTTKFGLPKKKISAEEIFSNPGLLANPVFVLSTGRCGTEWITFLLSKSPNTKVLHAPVPNLSVQGKFIFSLLKNDPDSQKHEIAKQIIFSGREQHFRYAYKTGKRYIETNNHITFFAPALSKIFPTARFIHLYRHPGQFVTSGMRRGWFAENKAANAKIIAPSKLDQTWTSYSRVEKIGWVWNETNLFIETFKKSIAPERTFTFNFNKLTLENLQQLRQFLNLSISDETLLRAIQTKRNVQKKGGFPAYEKWNISDQEALKAICMPLSQQYGYIL